MIRERNDCREIRLQISEGQPGEGMPDEIAAHLAGCALCLQFLSETHALEQTVRDLPRLSPSPDFTMQVMSRIEQEKNRKNSGIRRIPVVASIAACFLFVAAGWTLWKTPVFENGEELNRQTAAVEMLQSENPSGNPTEDRLSENNGSELLSDAVGF